MSLDQLTSMTKTITENAEQALTLFCINRKPYFDTETMEKFNNTYAGHVFEFLRNQLRCRQYLRFREFGIEAAETASIPHVVPELKEAKNIEAIIEIRKATRAAIRTVSLGAIPLEEKVGREAMEEMARRVTDKAEREARELASSLVATIEAFVASDVRESLLNLRNKYVAHSLEITDAEKRAEKSGRAIKPVEIGDIEPALRKTIDIVTDLNLLVRDAGMNLDGLEDVFATYADDFWGRFSKERRGHGFANGPRALPTD